MGHAEYIYFTRGIEWHKILQSWSSMTKTHYEAY